MQLDDDAILQEVKDAGGGTHGPIVETVTMPLSAYVAMRRRQQEQVDAVFDLYQGALKGYGGEGAHLTHAACVQMWKALGVDNQTAAMQKIRELMA